MKSTFKYNETVVHTLTRDEWLARLRAKAGLTFKVGDIVTLKPKAATSPDAADAKTAVPEATADSDGFIEVAFFGRTVRSPWQHFSRRADAADETPSALYIVVGHDHGIQVVTMDDDGDLCHDTFDPADLVLVED